MSFCFEGTLLYGKRYLTERVHEKPFFLGVNGITAKHVEGKPWKLSFNPIDCDLCTISLEDEVIFMLHVWYYNLQRKESHSSLFERFLYVFTRLIDRITDEMIPETMVEVDTIMSAYNLLDIICNFINNFNPSSISANYLESIFMIISKLDDLADKLRNDTNLSRRPEAIHMVITGCELSRWYIYDFYSKVKHNDLKLLHTRILEGYFSSILPIAFYIEALEDKFYQEFTMLHFVEDHIDIEYGRFAYDANYSELAEELAGASSDLEMFEIVNEDSMITQKNLDNFNDLIKMIKNQEKESTDERPSDSRVLEDSFKDYRESKDYSDQYLKIKCFPETFSTMKEYRLILEKFLVIFWGRRNERNEENECILFSSEETRFIFQFVTQVFKSLRILPKRDAEHEIILKIYLKDYMIVLNSLRFQEIGSSISLRTSAILSKTADELVVEDPYVSLFSSSDCFDLLQLITTKIINFLAGRQSKVVVFFETLKEPKCLTISECKSIDDSSQISKVRRSRWKEALENKSTAEDCRCVFNQEICPVCRDELKSDDLCIFICKHTACSSCTTELICNKSGRSFCPVCRSPVCEFIPSRHVAKICKYFQQSSAENN